jgi:hypothetical protein
MAKIALSQWVLKNRKYTLHFLNLLTEHKFSLLYDTQNTGLKFDTQRNNTDIMLSVAFFYYYAECGGANFSKV